MGDPDFWLKVPVYKLLDKLISPKKNFDRDYFVKKGKAFQAD